MAEFTMPSLGADMDEGTLQEWLVRPGERIRRGDPVAVVETAKSTIEVECFETGTVGELLVEPGRTVPVGTPLALIETDREEPEKPGRKPPRRRGPKATPPPKVVPPPPHEPAPAGDRELAVDLPPEGRVPHEAVPLVRRLARERGVDLGALHGSGPHGRITRSDVERAAARRPRPPITPLARRLAGELGVDLATVTGTGRHGAVRADDVRKAAAGRAAAPVSGHAEPARTADDRAVAMRRTIAGLMARSKRDIPHYYLSTTVDMAAAMGWLRDYNRRSPVGERLLPAALLLKAAALAVREVPALNGFWTEDRFTEGDGVHLGVAVSLRGGGLVAPALHDADRLPLPELMSRLKDLVTRVREGRLRGSEVSDPTITVTNLGDQGVESVLGVIYPPQVALIGFGRVVDRPCAVDGLLGVRPTVTATLSADHRATDGAIGARCLAEVDRRLRHPEEL
ncbi:dihydrolipoamide acetyltransferase family protein [Streptomyces luomodiensis]|uniref:Dihydrolipoamide acetyltransferase component of pyruvate dehydrogenase complex n=1 Tax=Streptomyces luomodiensis TaxID=3026192 RepID=A0ABY9V786_9ACTN|nr:dihydrolipoamide acetyltransferase family protein [Streptomyces sp. SCA4-21]WNF00753.1 dihydrolipoamide acetyltransferase family protein [Streptomyces sp. SCA4-21]